MKILQVTTPTEFEVREVPTPEPGAGEVLVRVEAVTTCPQWDLHLRHNEPMFPGHQFNYPYAPGQPGHEATGEIAAVGDGVTDVAVGDRVSTWRDPGHNVAGCYAQFVVRAGEDVIRVPPNLEPEALAPLELAMCVGATFVMLRPMNVLRGKRIGVTGLGSAGLIAAQMARAEGATEVIGFDLSSERRETALQRNLVDEAHDSRADLSTRFPARPKKTALDSGIDCVGAKASVEFMMDHVHDVVALFGVQREDYSFAPRHYHPGVRLCGYPGHSRAAAEYAVSLIEEGKLDLAPLVTHNFPLEKYGEAIDLLEKQQAVKVCFWPWRDS
jgi:2-desacetyl-2-hydroxyethyl bacteriochlorophyllide A dehydrogenase